MTNCLAWRDARHRNFRTAAAPFNPRIPAPLAQIVRRGSIRTILDLLEAWLITTAGFAEKLTKMLTFPLSRQLGTFSG